MGGEPMESADEFVGRGVVDVQRIAELGDAALAHHGHLVAQGQGLALVVGDVDGGGSQVLDDLLQFGAERQAEKCG